MSTMAIKSAVTMDHVKSGKKADFVSRFKNIWKIMWHISQQVLQ